MKRVTVGLIGAGFISNHHCDSFKRVIGYDVRLKTASDAIEERAGGLAAKYGFAGYTADYRNILADREIDVVDICTPPFLHKAMIIEAMKAGKHVICEKPLTGYFGREGDPAPIGDRVSKRRMYDAVIEGLDELGKVVENSGKLFMYAENYIYSPNVLKAAELIRAKKSRILFMRGEETLRGSTSPLSGMWDKTGGGSLIRVGTHPLAALLWLKSVEASARNADLHPTSVVADTARIVPALSDRERRHLLIRPVDVEDMAVVSVTFADGAKAVVTAADVCLGCVRNEIEIFANDGALRCRITPSDNMETYYLDEEGLEGVYLQEMLPSKTGWVKPFISEQIQRGYAGEMQDFIECVAEGRQPLSGYELAKETTKVLYAAYLSGEEGRRVKI